MNEEAQLWDAGPVKNRGRSAPRSRVRHEQCLYPHVTAQTGYVQGCRCDRCGNPKNRRPRPFCAYPGCEAPRAKWQRRWCAVHAEQLLAHTETSARTVECANVWCTNVFRVREIDGALTQMRLYCAECQRRLPKRNQLRQHHVSAERIEAWITTEKLTCPGCHRTFSEELRPVIDHDHGCCDGAASECGECVRDLLCNRCNVRLAHIEGAVRDGTIDDLIRYVRGWIEP